MKRAVLLFVLLWPSQVWGQITIPPEIKGEPGDFITVSATTKGAEVQWLSVDPGLKLFPVGLLKDTKTAIVIAVKPGKYRLYAWTAVDGKPTAAVLCIVIVGESGPNPPPPPPDDPLVKSLAAAWALETDPKKHEQVKLLALLYKQASATTVYDSELKTVEQLLKKMGNAADGVEIGLKGKLTTTRKAIADFLRQNIPAVSAPLDNATREQCAKAFSRVAAALEVLK